MIYKGHKTDLPGVNLVYEFANRKRLAKLGFTSPISSLPAWKAEAFIEIDGEIEKLNAKRKK